MAATAIAAWGFLIASENATHTMRGDGFAGMFQFRDEKFRVAPSGSRWADPDFPREFETRSGARAPWNWNVA